MNQADKDEVQKLLAQLQAPPRSRLSALFLKIAAGYAAMAVFLTAALLYSSFSLYQINRNARQIADTHLPVLMVLVRMRNSLLAQETFAGKYAIFQDPTFIQLFGQRKEDLIANLELLERTKSVDNITSLKRLYQHYQVASERLFTGKSRHRGELQASALRLTNALDQLYLERQGVLQTLLDRNDEQQKATVRWAIGISCAGFLLAVFIAPLTMYRIIRALGKLQQEAHRIACGDFNYHPQVPAVAEISELASDVNEMAARILAMEQMTLDARPLTALPGNLAIERVLNERLESRAAFSLCHLELDDFNSFLARYGYVKAGQLLHDTGVLIYKAVRDGGAVDDFAGHAGGDRFVMVLSPDRVTAVCEAVVTAFDAEVMKHLEAADREAETIRPTVSISVLDCDIDAYASAVEVTRAVLDLKDSLKKTSGSSWERSGDQEGELP